MMPKTSNEKKTGKEFKREGRTEIICFKASPKEKGIIERLANEEGITLSQYVRGSVMSDLVISGDIEAMKYGLSLLGHNVKAAIRENIFTQDSGEPVLT